MSKEIRLWSVADGRLRAVRDARLDLESRLEDWLVNDVSLLGERLLIIGRQVATDYGGFIDLLCLDSSGDLVVVELKRDRTPRDITAQVLDYASWVADLSAEQITEIAEKHLREPLEEAFTRTFESELPEVINAGHKLLVVGSTIDDNSERIIRYLSDRYGVSINAITFQYFRRENEEELLGRVFLLEPERVTQRVNEKGNTKRRARLSLEELESEADRNGVGDLYRSAVTLFRPIFKSAQTTRSSLRFEGKFASGTTGAVLNLIPTQRDGGGLPFQLYTNRAAQVFGQPADQIAAALPTDAETWQYEPGDDPWWHGHAGAFRTVKDCERLCAVLKSVNAEHAHG